MIILIRISGYYLLIVCERGNLESVCVCVSVGRKENETIKSCFPLKL